MEGSWTKATLINNSMANWKTATSGGIKIGRVNIKKRSFPRRLTIPITICDNHATTNTSTEKDESRIQASKKHDIN